MRQPVRRPEIIEAGKGREAQCHACGTRFYFFPENIWMGGRNCNVPHVYCPRDGCRPDSLSICATMVDVSKAKDAS